MEKARGSRGRERKGGQDRKGRQDRKKKRKIGVRTQEKSGRGGGEGRSRETSGMNCVVGISTHFWHWSSEVVMS